MKHLPLITLGLLSMLFLVSCDPTSDLAYGIDPTEETDMLNRALRVGNAQLHEGAMPASTGTLYVNSYPVAVEVSAGVLLFLPYSTNQNNSICKVYFQIEGAASYWEAPVQKDSVSGQPFIAVTIPNFIKEGDWNITFSVDDCKGNISRFVSTQVVISPSVGCGASISGSLGITVRVFDLGEKAGNVQVSYEMYSVPDRLDLRYAGKWIQSTGTLLSNNSQAPNCALSNGFVSGGSTFSFAYDPKKSRTLEVYVSGCYSGTAWDVYVQCP